MTVPTPASDSKPADLQPGRRPGGHNRSPWAALVGVDGDGDELSGPLLWSDIPARKAAGEWQALREWVERLVVRFDWDSHVLPGCWWRHNQHVEALVALRDHERGSYAPLAPPTAGVEFHRALRDIEARLRAWTAELRCEAAHHPSHDATRRMTGDGWQESVAADVDRRRQQHTQDPVDG